MSSYLPQETSVVCTMQMSPTPGKLLADPDARNLSVVHSKDDVMLTNADMLLRADFSCKNDWKGPVTWGAFFAGLAVGIALAAFTVVTFGLGAVIIGAVAVAAVATVAYVKSNSVKCSGKLQSWKEEHPSVKFDQNPALTQRSIMTCNVGGVLKPFVSEAAAHSAANEIAWANRADVTLSGVISFIFGASVGYTGGTTGLLAAGGEVAVGYLGALIVFTPLSLLEKEGIRAYNDTANGDTEYDRILSAKESIQDDSLLYDTPDDDYNPVNFVEGIKEIKRSSQSIGEQNRNMRLVNKMMNVQGTRKERNAAIESIAKQLGKTESGAKIVEAMRRGNGSIWQRGRTANKADRIVQTIKGEAKNTRSRALWGTRGKGFTNGTVFNTTALALPLLITPLDEHTMIAASNYAEEDLAEGNSINSTTH